MKKVILTVMMAVAAFATVSAQSSVDQPTSSKGAMALADARGQIDAVVNAESPALMKEIMGKLSAEDQLKFLADVNKAIADLPASVEEKTAKYLNLNHAAVKAAKKNNVMAVLAEVFATVPPEALTVVCERFAVDLINRSSDPNVTYTDKQFTDIAVALMKKINERTGETDNGSARSAFAIVMLLKASNGTIPDLADALIDTLPHDDAKELAKSEWIPAAMGTDGREQGFEPLLASADAGRRPDLDFTLVIAGPQYMESILEDIVGKNTDQMSFMRTRTPVLDAVENRLIHQIPTLGADTPGAAGQAGAGGGGGGWQEEPGSRPEPFPVEPEPGPGPDEPIEPHPYRWQTI